MSPGKPAANGAAAHPLGFPLRGEAGGTCGDCAWSYRGGRGRPVVRCRQTAPEGGHGRPTRDDNPACDRWEPRRLDCQACGACCREAYGSVTISRSEPVIRRHPGLVVNRGSYLELARRGPRCAALSVEDAAGGGTRYACQIYNDRPRPCRDFEPGGAHCLTARRRVGLSR